MELSFTDFNISNLAVIQWTNLHLTETERLERKKDTGIYYIIKQYIIQKGCPNNTAE
jgi:hypothetical protein